MSDETPPLPRRRDRALQRAGKAGDAPAGHGKVIRLKTPLSDRVKTRWQAEPGRVVLVVDVSGVVTEIAFSPDDAEWQGQDAISAASMARHLGGMG